MSESTVNPYQPQMPAQSAAPGPLRFNGVIEPADYRRMLKIIEDARAAALQNPRVDMPGAEISEGRSRTLATAP